MATAQTLIDRACRLVGAVASGESASTDETADFLIALNAMLESWNLDRLAIYALVDVTKVLTSSDAAYSIGSGGDINTTRPVEIHAASVTVSGVDLPLMVISKDSWDAIGVRSVTGVPDRLYYEPAYPLGVVNLYPVPDSTYTLTLAVRSPLTSFATAATSVSLPPGYERALAYNLAIEIAPELGRQVPAEVARIAVQSLAAIKRLNRPDLTLQVECATGKAYSILTDS